MPARKLYDHLNYVLFDRKKDRLSQVKVRRIVVQVFVTSRLVYEGLRDAVGLGSSISHARCCYWSRKSLVRAESNEVGDEWLVVEAIGLFCVFESEAPNQESDGIDAKPPIRGAPGVGEISSFGRPAI